MGSNFIIHGVNQKQSVNQPKEKAGQSSFAQKTFPKQECDVVEISQQQKKEKKKGFFNKKFLIALGLTLATVIGGATLGNKLSNKTAMWGAKFDAKWAQNPAYKAIADFFTQTKDRIVKFLKKSKTMEDILETLKKRRSTAKWDFARGYGRGFTSIFSLTPPDTLDKAFKQKGIKTAEEGAKLLRQIVGSTTDEKGNEIATKLAKSIFADGKTVKRMDNREFCNLLSEGIRQFTGAGSDNVKFTEALIELQKGMVNGKKVALDFTNITMGDKGFHPIGNWWPVNFVQKLGNKFNVKWMQNFCKGNLGDALIKYNAVNGSLAKTGFGSLIQKSVTVPTESITNFVNDKSGLGIGLCAGIYSLYNNVQDVPKGKVASTVADDYVGTLGSIAIATPLACATTYGLASLRNLEGKTALSKGLSYIGKFFGMGLDKISKDGKLIEGSKNKFITVGGGIMRFALIMFALTPKFQAPIRKAIHKIFGKPYDKDEEAIKLQQAQMMRQAQMGQSNAVIPELGITQAELIQKIQNNPEVIAKIQNDPKLVQAISKNPKVLLDLLDKSAA